MPRVSGLCLQIFFFSGALLLSGGAASCLRAQQPAGPTDAKAQATWDSALDWEKKGYHNVAIDELREANEKDGGHCASCLSRALAIAASIGDYKDATEIAHDWLAMATSDAEKASIHAQLGQALEAGGLTYRKKPLFAQSADEYKAAVALDPHAPMAHFGYGVALAQLHQDEQARAEFKAFLDGDHDHSGLERRVTRYLERIDLAREPLAPDFSVKTTDGRPMSRHSLAGKVVLFDFWASWCAPCRESIPKIADLVAKFAGKPFVVISVNLDNEQDKWLSMVRRYQMTWPQCGDGGFDGALSKLFAVRAIPATFTIDADGILEDQRVGDTDIEAKLKKMIARAEKSSSAVQ